jgi:hypothetical protein
MGRNVPKTSWLSLKGLYVQNSFENTMYLRTLKYLLVEMYKQNDVEKMMYLRSFCISGFSSQGFLYPGKIWRRTRKKVENRRHNQHDLEEFPLPDTLHMILSFSSCSGLALLMARVVERPHHERSRPNCHPTTLFDWRMSYVWIYTFLGHPTKDKVHI